MSLTYTVINAVHASNFIAYVTKVAYVTKSELSAKLAGCNAACMSMLTLAWPAQSQNTPHPSHHLFTDLQAGTLVRGKAAQWPLDMQLPWLGV